MSSKMSGTKFQLQLFFFKNVFWKIQNTILTGTELTITHEIFLFIWNLNGDRIFWNTQFCPKNSQNLQIGKPLLWASKWGEKWRIPPSSKENKNFGKGLTKKRRSLPLWDFASLAPCQFWIHSIDCSSQK